MSFRRSGLSSDAKFALHPMDEIADTNGDLTDASPDESNGEYQQPAGTSITIERFPDGVTIHVPPAGVWRGSSGFFAFALIWLGITGPISLCLLVGFFAGKEQVQGNKEMLWVLPLM